MKLVELLSTLVSEVEVIVADKDTGKTIITMQVEGYDALDATLKTRAVANWFVVNATQIKVAVGDPITGTTIPLDPDQLNGSVLNP